MIALRLASSTTTVQAGVLASGTSETSESMNSGWLTPHCSTCIPPIDGPITATTWLMPRWSISFFCDVTMSRIRNFGNFIRGCAVELEGDVVSPLAIASVQMMKYLVVSSALPGPMRKSRR
jgi:hypothetical protein